MPEIRRIRLEKRIERFLSAGHPWVWRNALRDPPGTAGDVVTVTDPSGEFLARGIADGGPIGVRVWTLRDEPVDDALLRARFEAAARLRDACVPPNTDAYRLLHGEGDSTPGIVVDVYGAHAVLRLDGTGITRWTERIADALMPVLTARGVDHLLLRTGKKGDAPVLEALRGALPNAPLVITEHDMKLHADVLRGQKTGLFLDQRESRARVRAMSKGARVLNLYGYTGGFSVAAALGGAAHVDTVDISADAVEMAQRNFALNGLDAGTHGTFAEDVPAFLHRAVEAGRTYDLIVSDPPNFAPSEDAVPAALESYRKLHAACLSILEPGGFYLAASCSSHVRMPEFETSVTDAASTTDDVLQVLDRWGAPPDHPRLLAFPEGDYLKAILVRTRGA